MAPDGYPYQESRLRALARQRRQRTRRMALFAVVLVVVLAGIGVMVAR